MAIKHASPNGVKLHKSTTASRLCRGADGFSVCNATCCLTADVEYSKTLHATSLQWGIKALILYHLTISLYLRAVRTGAAVPLNNLCDLCVSSVFFAVKRIWPIRPTHHINLMPFQPSNAVIRKADS